MSARITWRAKDRIGTGPAPRETVGGHLTGIFSAMADAKTTAESMLESA